MSDHVLDLSDGPLYMYRFLHLTKEGLATIPGAAEHPEGLYVNLDDLKFALENGIEASAAVKCVEASAGVL